MYTIKQASARTGVGAALIRAWERRYGVVEPTRTAAGYRLYDDHAIAVLSTMRGLVDSGWTASEAARAIAAGEVPVAERPAPSPTVRSTAPAQARANRDRLIAAFVAAAEEASGADTEAALDEILASGSFEAVVDATLMPALTALGDAWQAGRVSVGAEHASSAAVARRLATAYQAAGVPGRATVLVGLPPGARHELGALAFAAALRRRGVGVLYLGPDVTLDGWLDAVARTRASVAVLGITMQSDIGPAREVAAALRHQGIARVAIGGPAADGIDADDLIRLGDGVVDAANVVARITRRRTPR